jgi:hypothetical protein
VDIILSTKDTSAFFYDPTLFIAYIVYYIFYPAKRILLEGGEELATAWSHETGQMHGNLTQYQGNEKVSPVGLLMIHSTDGRAPPFFCYRSFLR